MNWISLDGLLLIHERVIAETGGLRGVTSPGGLESALARPFTAIDGSELFPDVAAKAAALIHSLVAFHPFADGNKRTALVAADVCLRLNGHRLAPSEEIEPFFWSIARGEQQLDEITPWLRAHTEPWDDPPR